MVRKKKVEAPITEEAESIFDMLDGGEEKGDAVPLVGGLGDPDAAVSPSEEKGRAQEGDPLADQVAQALPATSRQRPTEEDSFNAQVMVGQEDLQHVIDKQRPASVTPEAVQAIESSYDGKRTEEITDEMIKQEGRYIESVDNAKVGVPYVQEKPYTYDESTSFSPEQFAKQVASPIRADGVTLDKYPVLDTGDGAQKPDVIEVDEGKDIPHPFNDPSHPEFMVCQNNGCQYREGCLRYRLKDQRENKGLFYPNSCRTDGIYMPLDGSGITGVAPMEHLENSTTTSLPAPGT